MKIGIITDPHFRDTQKLSAKEYTILDAKIDCFVDIVFRMQSIGVEHIVVMGDLFNSNRQSQKVIQEVCDMFNELNCNFTVINGNHDDLYDGNSYSIIKSINLKNVDCVTEPKAYSGMFFAPYISTDYMSALKKKPVKNSQDLSVEYNEMFKPNKNIIFFGHMTDTKFAFASDNNVREIYADVDILKKFKFAFLGHIHKHQSVCENVMFTGSMCANSFGDISTHFGGVVYDTETNDIELVENNVVFYNTVETNDAETIKQYDIDGKLNILKIVYDKPDDQNGYIKFRREIDKIKRKSKFLVIDSIKMKKVKREATEVNVVDMPDDITIIKKLLADAIECDTDNVILNRRFNLYKEIVK